VPGPVGRPSLAAVKDLIRAMNPAAVVVESTRGAVAPAAVLRTGLFSLAKAEEHPHWLVEARHGEHVPESVSTACSTDRNQRIITNGS
jgi:G3E family GTPase